MFETVAMKRVAKGDAPGEDLILENRKGKSEKTHKTGEGYQESS